MSLCLKERYHSSTSSESGTSLWVCRYVAKRAKGVFSERQYGCWHAGYDRFYKATGGVWCTRWGMLLFIPAALLVPLATLFAHNRPAVMAQLFLAMAVNSIADTSAYSGSNVLVRPPAFRLQALQRMGLDKHKELDPNSRQASSATFIAGRDGLLALSASLFAEAMKACCSCCSAEELLMCRSMRPRRQELRGQSMEQARLCQR